LAFEFETQIQARQNRFLKKAPCHEIGKPYSGSITEFLQECHEKY